MGFCSTSCSALFKWFILPCVVLGAERPEATSSRPKDKPFFAKPFLLGAHRGGADLWPENTLVAFRSAAKRWPHILLETDARLTADGQAVLLHDDTVNRTTDGTGPVAEMTLAEVKKLDAGYRFTPDRGKTFPYRGKGVRIATLAEALAAVPDARFEVELKPCKGVTEPTLRVIRQAGAEDRVLLASFDSRLIFQARRITPQMAYCYEFLGGLSMLDKLRSGGKQWAAYQPKAEVLSLMRRMLTQYKVTPDEIRAMQAKGVYFQIHTPNTPQAIRQALDLNPDSVLTDRPDLLAELIAERSRSK